MKTLEEIIATLAKHKEEFNELTDTLCFHCQQTVEEAKEAFEKATNVKDFILKKLNIKEEDLRHCKSF